MKKPLVLGMVLLLLTACTNNDNMLAADKPANNQDNQMTVEEESESVITLILEGVIKDDKQLVLEMKSKASGEIDYIIYVTDETQHVIDFDKVKLGSHLDVYVTEVMESFPMQAYAKKVSMSESQVETTSGPVESTFGIRHDKVLSDYEEIAQQKDDKRPDFSGVVSIIYTIGGEEFDASGALIKDDWILTAGHNFFVAEEQDEPAHVEDIKVYFGADPNNPEDVVGVKQLVFHPTWLKDNDGYYYANDYALVELDRPVNIKPYDVYTGQEEPIGSTVWFAGFGDYSHLDGQDPDMYSKRHAIENILDRKMTGIITDLDSKSYTGGLLAFDFDDPSKRSNSLGDDFVGEDEYELGQGTSDPNPLEYEGTTVEGDSGGPLFIKDQGVWKIAGVLSGGAADPVQNHKDSSYGDISIFMRVSTQIDWIKRVTD